MKYIAQFLDHHYQTIPDELKDRGNLINDNIICCMHLKLRFT